MKTTRETLQKAMYQYLVDHSFPYKDDIVVSFIIPTEKQFAKKILAREKGYKRQSLNTLNITFKDFLNSKGEAEEKLKIISKKQSKYHKKINNIKKHGSLRIKLIIKLRDFLTTIINNFVRKENT